MQMHQAKSGGSELRGFSAGRGAIRSAGGPNISRMKKSARDVIDGFDMGFQPQGLFREASRLAEILAKIPEDVAEEIQAESGLGWNVEAAAKFIDRRKLGITAEEWTLLKARLRKQDDEIGVLEECLVGVASNQSGANIICPCALIARWDAGTIVMLQRYDSDWGDGEDRALRRFSQIPTFGEAIKLVGRILNDPNWGGGLAATWQGSLAKQLPWEMSVDSDVYPQLHDWFEREWQRVRARASGQPRPAR